MNDQGLIRHAGGRAGRLALPLGLALALGLPAIGRSQTPTPPAGPAPAPATAPAPVEAPAGVVVSSPAPGSPAPVEAVPGPGPAPAVTAVAPGVAVVETSAPELPNEIQVVRFQAPEGVVVEVLGPPPEPVPSALSDGPPPGLVGLRVGVGYRLKLSNLPGRPEAELYPVVEVVGHLHRPSGMDVGKFPIRIVFNEDDFVDSYDHKRLVTQVIYLEDPEQAIPVATPKGEIPIVTLSPSEDPIKVGAALGRVMAVVRTGTRKPDNDELAGMGIIGVVPGTERCPFTASDGGPCKLPCGPVCGTPPPRGRVWLPKDEFLCDGGDHKAPAHFGGDGGLLGIDPRDAVIQFNDERRARILPTNLVCIYAPRFAEVRVSVGPNEALVVQSPKRADKVENQLAFDVKQHPNRLTQNQGAEASRERLRASAMRGRVYAGSHTELRVLSGYDTQTHLAGHVKVQGPELASNRQKPGDIKENVVAMGIKTGTGAAVTGIVEGAGQMVMAWPARETVGVETPPNRPGVAVIKRVSSNQAEQGDEVTFVIQFRNMGNTPISAVSVVDSLLPRFGYVAGSAKGPKGAVFTAAENRSGSTELRWDLPGTLAPGVEGYVSFKTIVR